MVDTAGSVYPHSIPGPVVSPMVLLPGSPLLLRHSGPAGQAIQGAGVVCLVGLSAAFADPQFRICLVVAPKSCRYRTRTGCAWQRIAGSVLRLASVSNHPDVPVRAFVFNGRRSLSASFPLR